MAQETNLTKRERQKQRREERLARERAAADRARRNRLVAFAALGLVILGIVGFFVQQQLARRATERDTIAAAEARLGELGCTPIEAEEQIGAGSHISGDQLAASPPETIYPDRPAASGTHFENWVLTGVYDQQIDERILVHNLEHGYVNYYYDAEADPAQVEELTTWAQEQIDGRYPKIVVSPYGEALPQDANFATVAWGHRQLCGQFDTEVAQAFLTQHHSGEDAPERFLPPHRNEGEGIDPTQNEGPLLLPPLAEAEGSAPASDPTTAPTEPAPTPPASEPSG